MSLVEVVVGHERQNRKRKREHDVLLRQINAARKGKVKGKLTDEGKESKPLKIGSAVARVDVCLRDAEAEDGHGKAPDRAHPDLLGKEEVAYVVKNHGD